jgi:hypothetical protein
MYLQKVISRKTLTEIAGSGSASPSGSTIQRHGSADPDPDPDPHQNVMDPQHCFYGKQCFSQKKVFRKHPLKIF